MKEEYGHKKMIVWRNIDELNDVIYCKVLPIIPRTKFKLRDQIDRAVSSMGANFIEGYYSGSTNEFMRFLGYSRRSLAELEFWAANCRAKKLIADSLYSSTKDLIIRTGYLIDRLILSLRRKAQSS